MFPRRVIPIEAGGDPEEIATRVREHLRDLS
jgi:hypothetical protein